MEEDRISQLPDEILQLILSFIDTYEVVQTTILSKRWKDLWRSLPSLRFHLSHSAAHRRVNLANPAAVIALSPRFSRFISHFLSHRDATAPVHDFHLSLHTEYMLDADSSFVEECVLYAIDHGVQSLRLHAPSYLPLRLPASFFASTTLRELELRQLYSQIHVPGPFSLPNLKTLYIESDLNFDDDHGMEPFAGLPELEKLTLQGYPLTRLVLKAPKLRVLEFLQYSHVIEEISAPLLTSFRYEGALPLECSKMNLPMLEQVSLDIHGIVYNVKGLHQRCVRMLHQLGNATTVSLTLSTLEVLGKDGGPIEQSPPPFPNLKWLKVTKGRYKVRTVLQSVMNYLIFGLNFESLLVEFPGAVIEVEQNPKDLFHNENDNYNTRLTLFY